MQKLTLGDISDVRAYERERDTFRRHIIDMKRARRVALGAVVSLVFENRETVRFQIQELARAERMSTDAAIQAELDVYNALIPGAEQLSATLFVELTSKEQLAEWLPALVGIERAVALRIGEGRDATTVWSSPDAEDEAHMTRDDVTASVHYVTFDLAGQVDRFAAQGAMVVVDLPAYRAEAPLDAAARAALLSDLRS